MAIAIFSSLEGESLEDVGIRLAERWRIGHKDRDDGVILLVFVQDRQMRLEVGYGLEARLTDAVAGRVVREEIAPRFRERRYAEGLEAAVRAVYRQVQEGGAGAGQRSGRPPWPVLGFFGLMVLIAMILAAEVMRTRTRGRYTLGPGGWAVPPGRSWRSGGGPWVSGGGWGGGSTGGGFSGGGGSFGGGGASGRW